MTKPKTTKELLFDYQKEMLKWVTIGRADYTIGMLIDARPLTKDEIEKILGKDKK